MCAGGGGREGEGRLGARSQGGRGVTLLCPPSSLLHFNKTQEMHVTLQFEKLCSKRVHGGDLVYLHLDAEPSSSRAGPHLFCLNSLST